MARIDEPDYVFRDRYPERHETYALYDEESARARNAYHCMLDLPYGQHERMTFDLFPAARNSPLLIFFHGGYWQSLDKSRFSFVAAALRARGFSVALPNYPLAPASSLEKTVAAVTSSVPAIFEALARLGATPSCWLTSGHSAGGHLAIWAGTVSAYAPLARSIPFAGMVPISGMFDVRPFVGTSLNKALRLNTERADRLSPINHDLPQTRYRLLVGDDETPGIIGQSERFGQKLAAAGCEVSASRLVGWNHYTILKDLLSSDSSVIKEIEDLVGVGQDRADRRNDEKQAQLRQL